MALRNTIQLTATFFPYVESSRTSLASRTHFKVFILKAQVLGLGLEAYKSPKLLELEDSIIFWLVRKENSQLKIELNFSSVNSFFSLFQNNTMW